MKLKFVAVGLALLGLGTLAFADEYTTSELKAIGEGRGLYLKNCMPCHGVAVKGTEGNPQPTPGPDLTVIIVRDGRLDRLHLANHIRFGDQSWYASAPEPGQMPAWGRVLRARNLGNEGKAACDILKLVHYLEWLQETESPAPER
jgi:mono/diheme cytochrome c family protein